MLFDCVTALPAFWACLPGQLWAGAAPGAAGFAPPPGALEPDEPELDEPEPDEPEPDEPEPDEPELDEPDDPADPLVVGVEFAADGAHAAAPGLRS